MVGIAAGRVRASMAGLDSDLCVAAQQEMPQTCLALAQAAVARRQKTDHEPLTWRTNCDWIAYRTSCPGGHHARHGTDRDPRLGADRRWRCLRHPGIARRLACR